MHIVLTIILSIISCTALAQKNIQQDSIATPPNGKEDVLHGIYSSIYVLDDTDIEDWDDIQEQLTTLALSPRNINDITITELLDIPLVTEQQALAVIRYRSLYGDLHSMSELSLVTGLDRPYQQLFKLLFYAKPSTNNLTISPTGHGSGASVTDSTFLLKDAPFATYANTRRYSPLDNARHNILLTATIPTYQREGYRDGTYHGYQLNHSLRYTYQARRLQLGFTAAQDAGEPFFSGTNKKGYDFYTGFARLRNTAFIKDLVIGHYQISTGMGLILNNGYRLSRTALFLTHPEQRLTLRGHTSRQESNYLQGIATTINLSSLFTKGNINNSSPRGGWEGTFFASYRPLDATTAPIEGDSSTDDYTITTIQTTGYHRTDSEISHRNATYQSVIGASLATTLPLSSRSLNGPLLHLSLTGLHIHMANTLLPDTSKLYKRYAAYGKDFTNASLAYTLLLPDQRLYFAGETALSFSQHPSSNTQQKLPSLIGEGLGERLPNTHLATANTIRYRLGKSLTLFALQRFYSYQFISLLGKSFGDVSNTQDESGIYVGMSGLNISRTTLAAYVDYAYHPWPRYGYTTSSSSYDAYLQAIYNATSRITLTTRYRYRQQQDGQHTLRTLLRYAPSARWETRTQLQGTIIPATTDLGYLISQDIRHTFRSPLYNMLNSHRPKRDASLSLSLTYFNTSDYVTRLYITDRTVTYGSMTSMLFGHGMRLNLMAQLPLSNILTFSTHITSTQYFDRNQISSSHQLIDSRNQTDIQLQLGIRM